MYCTYIHTYLIHTKIKKKNALASGEKPRSSTDLFFSFEVALVKAKTRRNIPQSR